MNQFTRLHELAITPLVESFWTAWSHYSNGILLAIVLMILFFSLILKTSSLWTEVSVSALASLIRICAYFNLGKGESVLDLQTQYFFHTIRNHLAEYLWFHPIKPPLTVLAIAPIVRLLTNEQIAVYRPFVLESFIFGILMTWMIFKAANLISKNPLLSAFVALVASLGLMPSEYWGDGMSIDSITFSLTSVFLWCFFRTIWEPKNSHFFWTALSGTLLISDSIVNILIVPSFLILAIAYFWFEGSKLNLKQAMAICLLPLGLGFGLCYKNFLNTRSFYPSSLGGLNPGHFNAFWVMGQDWVGIRKDLEAIHAPAWYLWCFDHPSLQLGRDGKEMIGHDVFAKIGGQCFGSTWESSKIPRGEITARLPNDSSWPFHMEGLYRQLISMGATEAAEVAKMDWDDSCERPYLFSGFWPNVSGRWIAYYGNTTRKLVSYIQMHHPIAYIKSLVSTHRVFFEGGPVYLQSDQTRDFRNFENRAPIFWKGIFVLFAGETRLAYLMIPIFWILSFLIFCFPILRREFRQFHRQWIVFLSVTFAVGLLAYVFCQGASFEQERYFLQTIPYTVVFMAGWSSWCFQVGIRYVERKMG